jgi:pyrroloquinoline quinone biosynthesis protein D
MSTDRGRKRGRTKSQSDGSAPTIESRGVRLAPSVRLDDGEKKGDVPVLVCRSGKVQLNGSAVAILRLCDGSRTRENIVAELAAQSHRNTLAADIIAFLDVARARGWIIEP